jgi:predicted ABC-type ATPase
MVFTRDAPLPPWQRDRQRPRFWIIAGPNGCGKSTAYEQPRISDFDGAVWIINPDLLTARLRDAEQLDQITANLEAVRRIYRWLEESIGVHQTVGVETVLSTDKYRALVTSAKRAGYEIRLIYVIVESAEVQIERIRLRVAKGGHDVPDNKVRDRRRRSLEQLQWFFENADYTWIFDNSGAEPDLVLEWTPDGAAVSAELLDEVQLALWSKTFD